MFETQKSISGNLTTLGTRPGRWQPIRCLRTQRSTYKILPPQVRGSVCTGKSFVFTPRCLIFPDLSLTIEGNMQGALQRTMASASKRLCVGEVRMLGGRFVVAQIRVAGVVGAQPSPLATTFNFWEGGENIELDAVELDS